MKKITHSGINFTKYMQELYKKQCGITSIAKLEVNLNKQKDIACS